MKLVQNLFLLTSITFNPVAKADTYQKAAEALNLIGAKIVATDVVIANQSRCAGACHFHGRSIEQNTIVRWSNTTKKLYDCMSRSAQPANKMKCIKSDTVPDTYAPEKIGIARAGVGTKEFQNLFAQNFSDVNKMQLEFKKFVAVAQMPPFRFGNFSVETLPFYPPYFFQDQMFGEPHDLPLNDAEYKLLLDWLIGRNEFATIGPMAHMKELMSSVTEPTTTMPTKCEEKTSPELIEHIKKMNSFGWTYKHLVEKQTPMFGCDSATPLHEAINDDQFDLNTWAKSCFKNHTSANDLPLTKSWSASLEIDAEHVVQNTKLLLQLLYPTSYWMRSSADGRFIGNSISRNENTDLPNNAKAYVVDLAQKRSSGNHHVIAIDASYDPGFFADNKTFTWHLGSEASICQQSILENTPVSNKIPLINLKNHPLCSTAQMQTYQNPAASLSQNSGRNDYWMITSDFSSDDAGIVLDPNSRVPTDPTPEVFAKPDVIMEVYNIYQNRLGNGNPTNFNVNTSLKVKTPYEGDFYASPSGLLLSSRIASKIRGKSVQLGFRINSLDYDALVASSDGSSNSSKKKILGEYCFKGSKASFSFNERFIITQHVTENIEEDRIALGYAAEGQPAPVAAPHKTFENFKKLVNKSANIYLFDLYTNKKYLLTDMPSNHFAVYPHFRADGWIYYLVKDFTNWKDYVMATDAAILIQEKNPL